ncbi:MAG: hypothetical protein V2J25_04630 [Desulfatiglans sp.]|nr:hypothetical protein [Desulfatiglans sp.]
MDNRTYNRTLIHFSEEGESYIKGCRCKKCGYQALSKKVICPFCLEETMESIRLGDTGELEHYSIGYVPLPGLAVPYIDAAVKTPELLTLNGFVRGCEAKEGVLKEGQAMKIVIGKLRDNWLGGEIIGWWFELLDK